MHIPRLRLIAFLLVIPAIAPSAHAQSDLPVVLSERIGPTIDSLEREYFALFPKIGPVAQARASRAADGTLRIYIDRTEAEDTSITFDNASETQLVRFIDNYEQYLSGDLAYGVASNMPYRLAGRLQDPRELRFELIDGRVVSGVVAYVDGRGVVVFDLDGMTYDWRRLHGASTTIPAAAIDRVIVPGLGPIAIAAGVATAGSLSGFLYVTSADNPTAYPLGFAIVSGAFVGAAVGASFASDFTIDGDPAVFRAHVEEIAEERLFSDLMPPELRRFSDSALDAVQSVIPPVPGDRSFDALANNRLSVAVAYSMLVTGPGSEYSETDRATKPAIRPAIFGAMGISVEGMYELSSWLGVGGGLIHRFPVDTLKEEREIYSELGVTALAEVNLMPRRVLGRKEVELLVGAGIGASRVAMEATMSLHTNALVQKTQHATMATVLFTALARVQVRTSIIDRVSIQAGVLARWYPTLTVPEYGFEVPTTGEMLRTSEPHEFELSAVGFDVGLRYRF